MGWFVFALILLLVVTPILFLIRPLRGDTIQEGGRYGGVSRGPNKSLPLWVKLLPVPFALLFILFSITTIVGPKQVGVVQTFGAVSDRTLDPGLTMKAPWQSVTELDGTKIPLKFVGREHCIGVKIADQSIACASVVLRYHIKKDQADTLYSDYRGIDQKSDTIDNVNDAISDTLIRTKLTSSLAAVFRTVDPAILPADSKTGEGPSVSEAVNYDELSQATTEQLESRVDEVIIDSVDITFLRVSDATQNRIEKLQEEAGKTRIAEQAKETAKQTADANRELASSIKNDPNLLVSKCLDILKDAQETKYELPAGFNCVGGSSPFVVTGK